MATIFALGTAVLGQNVPASAATATSQDQVSEIRWKVPSSLDLEMKQAVGTFGLKDDAVGFIPLEQLIAASGMIGRKLPVNDGYAVTIARVEALRKIEDPEEAPAPHALESALAFLEQTYQRLLGDFPKGATAVGDDGSIDVYWRRPGRTVQVTVPAHRERPIFIYYREGAEHSSERDASPSALAERLAHFAHA